MTISTDIDLMRRFLIMLIVFTGLSNATAEVAPEHVESMLHQMVRENVISATQAEKVKFRMKSISPSQWTSVNKKTAEVGSRTPASVTPSGNTIEEVNDIDLDGAQFKAIQSEIRKIVPEYSDKD